MVGPVERAWIHLGGARAVAVSAEALLVHLEHVVGVHEVLDEELPVGRPHVDLIAHGHIAPHVEPADNLVKAGETGPERLGLGIEVHEHEAVPQFESHLRQTMTIGAEGCTVGLGALRHVWSTDERTVVAVHPGVVRAGDTGLVAAPGEQLGAAVDADIFEGSDRVLAANDHDRTHPATGDRQISTDVVADVFHVGCPGDALPILGEHRRQFGIEHLRRGIHLEGQHACLFERKRGVRSEFIKDRHRGPPRLDPAVSMPRFAIVIERRSVRRSRTRPRTATGRRPGRRSPPRPDRR